MRSLPPALAAHLGEGVTTLCRCWKLTRRDGLTLGFTDHDRDLALEGVTYTARSGLEAAEAASELGFAVGGGDVSGALTSGAITEAAVAAGLYDDATVETRLVNWADPAQNLLLDRSSIGEIRRADDAFVAELRGPLHRFDETRGLVYRATCSADLGDSRCGVDLATVSADSMVTDTDDALTVEAVGLAAFPDGWFAGGRLSWRDGANAAQSVEIKAHRAGDATASFDLWQRAPRPIAAGDAFTVAAGCDKRLATCRDKFANVPNFRGFPHLPGNDFILRVPLQGEPGLDGGSLFR